MEGFQGMLNKYQYPFENVVFEGGSNRLLPFCGAVRTLEESGVWQQMKRLGGSGSGSIMASMLAVGFNSQQLETLFKDDLQGVIKDGGSSNCCLCCVNSGYNSGKTILKWLGSKFKECTGKADITFADIQKRFSKELCIVATNLTEGGLEYHHVKTTPDLRVVDSVRMSLATPVLMESVKNVNKTETRLKTENWFVEGGVLCNYPIHAFDGWWLSLDEDHTFLKKLPQLESPVHDRFSSFNSKTIGFITCDEANLKRLPTKLRDQVEATESATRPQDSKLLKSIEKLASDKAKLESRYTTYSSLANQFVKTLEESKKSKFDSFTRDDLRAIFTKCQLTDDELNLLFGTSQADDIFRKFSNKDKKDVNVQDVYAFLEKGRNAMYESVVHVKSPKLNSNVEQLKALSDLLHVHNLTSCFLSNNKNIERTVVIPTGYIDSKVPGKSLSKQEKQYLVEQGKEATRYYLESYIKRVPLLKEEGEKNSFSREDLKQFIDDDVSEVIDEKDYLESYLEKVL